MKKKEIIKRIARLIAKYKLRLLLSLMLAIVIVVSTLLVPIFIASAVDSIIGVREVDFIALRTNIFYIIAAILVTVLSQWFMNDINNSIVYHIVKDLRDQSFAKIQRLPVAYIDFHSHGDIVSKIINDIDQFSEGLLLGFSQFFTGILTIVITLVFMFLLHPMITLLVICLTPLSMFIATFITRKTYVYYREQASARGSVTGLVNEMIQGIGTVKLFGMEEQVCEMMKKENAYLQKTSIMAIFFSSITNPSTRFVNAVIYATVAISGALTVLQGGFSIGSLTGFLSYAQQYTKPFNEISGVVAELQNSIACAERVFTILETEEYAKDIAQPLPLQDIKGEVILKEVDFSYSADKSFMKNLNLEVNAGESVAIVGPTGCGKTTLINLLMRFYEINGGSICVDGKDIRDVRRKELISNYGMVLQDTWIKPASVKDNIAMAKPDASMEEIVNAAKKASAHGFISKLPKEYDTLLGGEYDILSAGQKQLICIARVMLAPPPILILDEATSSIDTRTELKIGRAFHDLMQGRTSFVVAHRLSTIKDADTIIVMKDGQIIEKGNHEALLGTKGFYYELYQSQFAKV